MWYCDCVEILTPVAAIGSLIVSLLILGKITKSFRNGRIDALIKLECILFESCEKYHDAKIAYNNLSHRSEMEHKKVIRYARNEINAIERLAFFILESKDKDFISLMKNEYEEYIKHSIEEHKDTIEKDNITLPNLQKSTELWSKKK